ncbi:MAG: YfiR family protein [Steroidobacteraceae bacterium]|jgi:hypothetical protein
MNVTRRIARNVSAIAATVCVLSLASLVCPSLAEDSISEDSVKAAYLYRFAGYVDWPQEAAADSPFIIDVLDSPGVARELRRLLPNHFINKRVAQVREISLMRDLGQAQMVYVAAGHANKLRALKPAAGSPALLLISDEEGGLNAGSALNFLTIDRNVRFEVSLPAAERWGLKISSDLLGVAIRVLGSGRQSKLTCRRPDADGIDGGCAIREAVRSSLSQQPRGGQSR